MKDLDLDDVAATSPKAKAELEELRAELASLKEETSGKKKCGLCAHWSHSTKRNCSSLAAPSYYAECLYPIDDLMVPDCVEKIEMHEVYGTKCPCFAPMKGGE